MAKENRILDDNSLDTLFRSARTHSVWTGQEVSDVLIQAVYDLMKWGPTSANSCPARFLFLKSKEAKEKLKPFLDPGNIEKTMTAPVTVVVGADIEFYEKLPVLFPHADARSWFVGNDELILKTAMRNSSLQGAYLMMAARALGLDCGPMSGFNNEAVSKAFFPRGKIYVNFLCNIGYGDAAKLHPRGPRLPFDEACKIL